MKKMDRLRVGSLLEDRKDLRDIFLYEGDKPRVGRAGELHRPEPCVSRYLIEKGMAYEYPDHRPFSVCLTHDVDDIYPPPTHTLLSVAYSLGSLDLARSKKFAFWKKDGKTASPYRNLKSIMAIEEQYGARSSFYFIATERDIKRFRYDIEDLEGELGDIVDRGWEAGLHGGYYAYNDLDEVVREKKRLERTLGREVVGYRNHYLNFEIPGTWHILEKAGFKYDTTLGYRNTVGFRNGMCHPFIPSSKYGELNIVEIPLTIMDSAIFEAHSFARAWEIARQLVDIVEGCNGVITLLWHNDVFNSPFRKDWERLYRKILDYAYHKKAWLTSGENIWKWSLRS